MFPEKAGSTGIMPNDLMRSRIFNCKRGIVKEMILKQRLRWFVNRNLGYRDAVLSWDCKIIKTAVDGYFFDTLNHHHQFKHACIYTQKHIEAECLPTKQDNPGFYFKPPHRGVRGLNPGNTGVSLPAERAGSHARTAAEVHQTWACFPCDSKLGMPGQRRTPRSLTGLTPELGKPEERRHVDDVRMLSQIWRYGRWSGPMSFSKGHTVKRYEFIPFIDWSITHTSAYRRFKQNVII